MNLLGASTARSGQTTMVCIQAVPQLPRWKVPPYIINSKNYSSSNKHYRRTHLMLLFRHCSLPGDYGFDPLGLSDPEGPGGFIEPKWLAYGEVINGRYAMLGSVGIMAPEILGKFGLIPPETALPWFKTGVFPPAGTYDYWADPYTLFVFEMALMGFAEHRRFQDWCNPGCLSKQYFLGLEKYFVGTGNPIYPGGPLFNPLGLGKDEKSMNDLKLKEVKNGRLAMLAILGYFAQAPLTGVGPLQNLLDHLADPINNNIVTSLKFH